MRRRLPARPNLEHLRTRAKALGRPVRRSLDAARPGCTRREWRPERMPLRAVADGARRCAQRRPSHRSASRRRQGEESGTRFQRTQVLRPRRKISGLNRQERGSGADSPVSTHRCSESSRDDAAPVSGARLSSSHSGEAAFSASTIRRSRRVRRRKSTSKRLFGSMHSRQGHSGRHDRQRRAHVAPLRRPWAAARDRARTGPQSKARRWKHCQGADLRECGKGAREPRKRGDGAK
jgi:hypothetical protein